MKRILMIPASFLVIILLVGWRAPEPKDGAIFYGTLTTQQGNKDKVYKIEFGSRRLTTQIPVYEKPKKHPKSVSSEKNNTNLKEITLTVDPRGSLKKSKIDLDEVLEFHIPSPNTVWRYQKEEGYRRAEYIEIVITKKSKKKKKILHLIERDTVLYCNIDYEAGPEEQEVPLPALHTLTIEGRYYKHDSATSPPSAKAPQASVSGAQAYVPAVQPPAKDKRAMKQKKAKTKRAAQ